MMHDGLIPSIQFDETMVGKKYCFDAWREAMRPIYDVEPSPDAVGSGRESINAWLLDNLIFSDVTFSRQSFNHHSLLTKDANYLSLQIYKQGSSRGVNADTTFELEPGEVQIFDFSRDFQSVTENSNVAGVVIPHEAIGYDPGRHPALVRLPADSPTGGFLMEVFLSLMGRLPEVRQDEAKALADGFCGLLRGIVIPEPSGDPRTRKILTERHDAMRDYLDGRLDDPGIGAERLYEVFSASRASIYRCFAESGGVESYITSRRLDRAFQQLLSTTPYRGQVQEIADRWGFADASHFSRLFRNRFGIPPSDVAKVRQAGLTRASMRKTGGYGPRGSANMGDWLETIAGAHAAALS